MQKYLVKVALPEAIAAKRIADSVRSIGSHFATHAAWRRKAGVCTGTMLVEAADRWGALGIVPPGMRADTHVFDAVRPRQALLPTGYHRNDPCLNWVNLRSSSNGAVTTALTHTPDMWFQLPRKRSRNSST